MDTDNAAGPVPALPITPAGDVHYIAGIRSDVLAASCDVLLTNGARGTFNEADVTCPKCKKLLAARTAP